MHSWLCKYGLHLEHQPGVLKKIDREVGIESGHPTFGEYELEIEGKDSQNCPYWNTNVESDVATEVELHLRSKLLAIVPDSDEQAIFNCLLLEDSPSNNPFILDYDQPGFDTQGVTCLVGGDHGDHRFRMFTRLHFCSPHSTGT
jgi:hypothetical protein